MSCFLYGGNSKKSTSGILFPGSNLLSSISISLDFTPTKVMIFLNDRNSSTGSIPNGLLTTVVYDFSTTYGFLYGRTNSEDIGYGLYSTSSYRPTFSTGTLTFSAGPLYFYSISTAPYGYTWMAIE